MTNEQKTALRERLARIDELDLEVQELGDKAEATGDLSDDLDTLRGRIGFGMTRAIIAGFTALGEPGELEGLSPLLMKDPHMMTDPGKIIERCDTLIDAAVEFIFDVRQKLGSPR